MATSWLLVGMVFVVSANMLGLALLDALLALWGHTEHQLGVLVQTHAFVGLGWGCVLVWFVICMLIWVCCTM